MVKNQKPKKHVPQRTCVGCRSVQEKRSLIRIVRSSIEGVRIDPRGKLPGRGAYLHDNPVCWKKGLKGSLAQALKTTLTKDELELLNDFMQTLSAKNQES